MSLNIKDRIYQETATEGTGTLTLTAVKDGYQGFVALPNGSTTYYCITNDEAWEVGQGQYLNDGTDTLSRTLLSSSTGALLDLKGNSSVFCTYPAEKGVILNFDGNIYLPNANIQGQKFIGSGAGLTDISASGNDLVSEAPADGETYARNNKTWTSISDTAGIPDAPVDGLMYGRKDGEWDPVADAGDFYTKEEIDAQQKTQDDDIIENNDDIARQQIEINNQQTSIDKNASDINEDSSRITTNSNNITTNASNIAQNTADIVTNNNNISTNTGNISTNTGNISSNTTAIGSLSGQVNQNSEDISELQDSIFFSSAYSADYPASPNRDPENGNMYLQNFAMFTYSYADATQIFASKTDESGNVRQFTAVKAGDSIVLNQVDSPNYGRYELVSIEDVSDSYVVMNVTPKLGEGTLLEGDKVAFQAFPKVGLWDENETNGYGLYPNNIEVGGGVDVGSAANGKVSNTMLGRNASGQNTSASAINNVSVGYNAFAKMSGAKDSVAIGCQAMKTMVSGSNNTAIGSKALELNPDGKSNVAIGAFAGSTLASGDNNILIGDGSAPSATTVSNEITLGNGDSTVVRMGNGDILNVWKKSGNDVYFTNNNNGLYVNTSQSNSVNLIGYNGVNFDDLWLRGTNIPNTGVGALTDGRIMMPDVANTSTGEAPNLFIGSDGQLITSTVVAYSKQEVEGLVNAKDVIIDKLTARLDALEKRVK